MWWDWPRRALKGMVRLEQRGARGATFFELVGYLSGRYFRVVNTLPGHDRHISYGHRSESRKKQAFEFPVYHSIARWAHIPIVAVAPILSNLVIQKAE